MDCYVTVSLVKRVFGFFSWCRGYRYIIKQIQLLHPVCVKTKTTCDILSVRSVLTTYDKYKKLKNVSVNGYLSLSLYKTWDRPRPVQGVPRL